MILIGLAGQAGTGKDTVADMLAEMYGWKKFSLSDALYDEVAAAFAINKRFLIAREYKEAPAYGLALENCRDISFITPIAHDIEMPLKTWLECPRSPRWILQKWGTEYRRGQDPDYWIKRAAVRVEAERQAGTLGLVNTSTRFPNEATFIRLEGGTVVHVRRDQATAVESHVSELPLPVMRGPDVVLPNQGTLDDLRSNVINLHSDLLIRQFDARTVSNRGP